VNVRVKDIKDPSKVFTAHVFMEKVKGGIMPGKTHSAVEGPFFPVKDDTKAHRFNLKDLFVGDGSFQEFTSIPN